MWGGSDYFVETRNVMWGSHFPRCIRRRQGRLHPTGWPCKCRSCWGPSPPGQTPTLITLPLGNSHGGVLKRIEPALFPKQRKELDRWGNSQGTLLVPPAVVEEEGSEASRIQLAGAAALIYQTILPRSPSLSVFTDTYKWHCLEYKGASLWSCVFFFFWSCVF